MQEIVLLTMQDLDITIGYDERNIKLIQAQIQALIPTQDRCFFSAKITVQNTAQNTAYLTQNKIIYLIPVQFLFCSVFTKNRTSQDHSTGSNSININERQAPAGAEGRMSHAEEQTAIDRPAGAFHPVICPGQEPERDIPGSVQNGHGHCLGQ